MSSMNAIFEKLCGITFELQSLAGDSVPNKSGVDWLELGFSFKKRYLVANAPDLPLEMTADAKVTPSGGSMIEVPLQLGYQSFSGHICVDPSVESYDCTTEFRVVATLPDGVHVQGVWTTRNDVRVRPSVGLYVLSHDGIGWEYVKPGRIAPPIPLDVSSRVKFINWRTEFPSFVTTVPLTFSDGKYAFLSGDAQIDWGNTNVLINECATGKVVFQNPMDSLAFCILWGVFAELNEAETHDRFFLMPLYRVPPGTAKYPAALDIKGPFVYSEYASTRTRRIGRLLEFGTNGPGSLTFRLRNDPAFGSEFSYQIAVPRTHSWSHEGPPMLGYNPDSVRLSGVGTEGHYVTLRPGGEAEFTIGFVGIGSSVAVVLSPTYEIALAIPMRRWVSGPPSR